MNSTSTPKWKKWGTIFLLFSIFPIGILWLGWSMVETQSFQHQINQRFEFLEKTISSLKEVSDSPEKLSSELEILNSRTGAYSMVFGCLNLIKSDQSFPFKKEIGVSPLDVETLVEISRDMRFKCLFRKELPWGYLVIAPLDLVQVAFGFQVGKPWSNSYANSQYFFYFLILLILLSTAFLCHIFFSGEKERFVSIKVKLIGLFLYATAFPGFTLVLLGFEHTANREKMLVRERFSEMKRYCQNIEENFLLAVSSNIEMYQRIKASDDLTALNWKGLETRCDDCIQKGFLNRSMIFDNHGDLIWERDPLGESRQKESLPLSRQMKKILRNFEKTGESVENLEQPPDFFNLISMENRRGKPPILEEQNWYVVEMENLRRDSYYFFTSFITQQKKLHFLVMKHEAESLCERFFNRFFSKLRSSSKEEIPFQIGILRIREKLSAVPPDFLPKISKLEMFQNLPKTGVEKTFQRELVQDEFLLFAKVFRWAKEDVICLITPTFPIQQTLFYMRLRVVGISILSSVFAFLMGVALSRQFLRPIQELTDGIGAVEKMEFVYRIPPLFNDELGELGNHINKVIPNLEEMHVGRAVQAALIPKEKLEIGDFVVEGFSQPMTAMMGDYYDFFPLDERFAVCLLGDVAGHGAPAALVMAIAKGCVEMLDSDGARQIKKTLEKINKVLLKTSKKRMMTLSYMVLDAQEKKVHLGNAGQSYPYFYSAAKKTACHVILPSTPLGMSRKPKFPEQDISFEPGDALILYSDGLVEAVNEKMEMFGFDRLQNVISKAAQTAKSLEDMKTGILKQFSSFVQNQPRQDDISLLIIKRKGQQ